jgi:plastocyanin
VVQYIRIDWRHARGAERAVRRRPTARNGDFDVAMPPKKTVRYVLKKAGAVEYYCRFHSNMKAVSNVAP